MSAGAKLARASIMNKEGEIECSWNDCVASVSWLMLRCCCYCWRWWWLSSMHTNC